MIVFIIPIKTELQLYTPPNGASIRFSPYFRLFVYPGSWSHSDRTLIGTLIQLSELAMRLLFALPVDPVIAMTNCYAFWSA
jgi:hypothetical protein